MDTNGARKLPIQVDHKETTPNSGAILAKFAIGSATFFFAANLITGFFNYLFQVMASKSLSAAEFSQLNAWFADLAVLFFFGGLIQYYGIFFPARRAVLRASTLAINVLALTLVALWQFTPEGQNLERGLLIFTSTTSLAWLIGQMHYRKYFATIGTVNLVNSLSKLGLILVPLMALSAAEGFRFAYFICFLPALWVLSAFVWRLPEEKAIQRQKHNNLQLWFAPAVMSLAAAAIPQMDMVITSRLFAEPIFHDFAHSSLFARGIYFVFLIVAQWLLPFQLQGQLGQIKYRWMIPVVAGLALTSALAIALASPWVAENILGWQQAPPISMVFMACLNMNLLTWIFILVQKNCAEGNARLAAFALLALALEGAIQFLSHFSSVGYFTLAIATQVVLIGFLSRKPTRKLAVHPQV